ncbi:MAG: prenyltransferase [Methanophagales archaeon]|nr:prenyltransferase [Methanophagales archaeon]
MANKLIAWIRIQELHKHLTTQLPFLLGTSIAWFVSGTINWSVLAISVIAVYFLTNACFISNEYFDYETDKLNLERIGGDEVGVTTTGGTRVLVEGLLPRRQALIASIIFFFAAIPLGLLLQFYFKTGVLTLPIGILAGLMGLFYTAPPIKASHRGLGEAFLCVDNAAIPVFMGYYLQQSYLQQDFSLWLPLIVALPWIIHAPAMKIIREFPDYEADLSTNRRNLVVIFGKEKMAPIYILLTICALILFIPVIFIVKGAVVLLLLLLLPAFFLLKSLIPAIKGEWKSKEGLETICKNGFIGMLFILVALIGIFILGGLFG